MGEIQAEGGDRIHVMPQGIDRALAPVRDVSLGRSGNGSIFSLDADRSDDGIDVTITQRALEGVAQRHVRLEMSEGDDGRAVIVRPEVVGLGWDASVRDAFVDRIETAASLAGARFIRMHTGDALELGTTLAARRWDFVPGYDEADPFEGEGFDSCPALRALDRALADAGIPPMSLHPHQFGEITGRIIEVVRDATGNRSEEAEILFGEVLNQPVAFLGAIAPNPLADTRPHYGLAELREFADCCPDAFTAFHVLRRSLTPSEWTELSVDGLRDDDPPVAFGAAWISEIAWFGEKDL